MYLGYSNPEVMHLCKGAVMAGAKRGDARLGAARHAAPQSVTALGTDHFDEVKLCE